MTTYNETLIDSSSIVSLALDGQVVFDTTISELTTLLSTLPLVHPTIIVNNTLTINQSVTIQQVTTILDQILTSVNLNSTIVTKETVTNILSVISATNIIFKLSLSSSISFTETYVNYLNNLISLYSTVAINSTLSSKFDIINSITESIVILDEAKRFFVASITDALVIVQTINDLFDVLNTVIDSLNLTNITSDSLSYFISILDTISSTETYTSKLTGKNALVDAFIIRLPELLGDDTFLGYVFSPETRSVATYSNYKFTKAAKFNNKYLFSNSTGLYEYGNSDDDGTLITSYIKTAGLTFGTSDKKAVPTMYLGYTSDGTNILKVSPDGIGSFYYKLNKHSNNLETKKMDIGKGLEGRYFQFEIITDATTFNLESIEFLPMIIKRKM